MVERRGQLELARLLSRNRVAANLGPLPDGKTTELRSRAPRSAGP